MNGFILYCISNTCIIQYGNKPYVLFWLVGKLYEKVCEACHITLNKIAIFGDNGTIIPGGVRIGK